MTDTPTTRASAPGLAPDTPLTSVIVADDEHLVASGIVKALASLGIETLAVASTGLDAVRLAAAHKPQMALLDIRMPDLDGLDAAQQIWDELDIPSVMISAFGGDNYLARAQQTGVFGYIIKPATAEPLRAALAVAWARARNFLTSQDRVVQLEGTLAARRAVEQAKWKLVAERSISEPEAHALLQRIARNARKRISEVAADLLNGHPLPDGHPPPAVPPDAPTEA